MGTHIECKNATKIKTNLGTMYVRGESKGSERKLLIQVATKQRRKYSKQSSKNRTNNRKFRNCDRIKTY